MNRGVAGIITVVLLAVAVPTVAAEGGNADPPPALADEGDSHVYGRIVSRIEIIGLKTTKPYIVKRELTTKVGRPFTKENEKRDYENLDRLQIFSSVSIYTSPDGDGGVAVFVEVEETFAYLPVISISISDENGISVGVGMKSVNLFGRAVWLSGVARFGGETTIEFTLRDPWIVGNHFGYEIRYFHRNRDNVIHGFYETADEAYLTLGSYMGERGRIGGRIYYQTLNSDVSGKTISPDNTDHVISGDLFIGYDSIDMPSNPHRGWYANFEITRSGLFGTDSDFWQSNIDLRRYQPLGNHQTLALFSLYTPTGGQVGANVAPWQTFGIGGSNSVRGYEVGYRIGKNQFLNTVEYRWNFLEPRSFSLYGFTASLGLQLALFTDFGSAWDRSGEFGRNFIAGGGTGLRLLLPYVGMVRLDVGFGEGDPWIMFHMASKEKAVRQRQRVR